MTSTIYFRKTYKQRANRIRRAKGLIGVGNRRNVNVYDTQMGTGKFYKRTGSEKTKQGPTVAGVRGCGYTVAYRPHDSKGKGTGYVAVSGPFKTREQAVRDGKKPRTSTRKPSRRVFGVRRGYGDDLYSWCVYDKRTGRTVIDGESRQQASYLADKLERDHCG